MDPQLLKPFLDDPDRPAGTLRYHELQGFLFTVVSAPELIPPSEWLPIIFGEADAEHATLDQAQEILGQIMALYNAVNAAVLDPPTLAPQGLPLRDAVLANFEDDAPMAQWPPRLPPWTPVARSALGGDRPAGMVSVVR